MRNVSAETALASVRSGDRVYVQGGAGTPAQLIDALMARWQELQGVEIVHLHTEISAPYVSAEFASAFRHNALFIGPNTRPAVAEGRADYTPVFLSEIPALFAQAGALPLDVALVQVAPSPDGESYSLGVSVDCALAAVREARLVIAQLNSRMPFTYGASIPASAIDIVVEADAELPEVTTPGFDDDARAIAQHVASLVEDGATLQLGIGSIPSAVLSALSGHRQLGVHTEMFTDALIPLLESGVVDGSQKSRDRGMAVSSFVLGSRTLYDFVDRNPAVELRPANYTNDVDVIASQHRMVAINSALSVDLTGQVAADSIGHRFYSGIGGQVDFIRGAARSRGGVPIIALPSTAAGGSISRICAELAQGSGVVTTRGDVHWVVTEYGARNLHGRTIRDRARMLVEIAHPQYREQLERDAFQLGYLRSGTTLGGATGPGAEAPQCTG